MKLLQIHPQNPQNRLIEQAADAINRGAVAVIPTDSCYALACHLDDKSSVDKIRAIRQSDKNHKFTLICEDLSQISEFAKVDNESFRILKNNTPGAFTFILKATGEVPKRLMHPKRKHIGIRVPNNNIIQALLHKLDAPLMSCSFILPDTDRTIDDIDSLPPIYQPKIDLIIDGGICQKQPSTVVHLENNEVQISRHGLSKLIV